MPFSERVQCYSGTKDVRLSASERYPTSEWTHVGDYVAEDSRVLQSFIPQVRGVYAKFIKVSTSLSTASQVNRLFIVIVKPDW